MITVLGSTGYVGSRILAALLRAGEECRGLSRKELDYTDRDSLMGYLRQEQPDFVINAAGYTGKPNVDACETDKANCLDGNAVLPGIIAESCRELGIGWGHVSSGCIFSGRREDGCPFEETDAPNFSFRQNNCSFYSGTKALGEEAVGYGPSPDGKNWIPTEAETGYLWRLRIPFNKEANPRNYLAKLMHYNQLLEAENSISQLDEFVRVCLECWTKRVPFGIYNVTNPGSVTTREVVEKIRESAVGRKRIEARGDFRFFEDEATFMQVAAKTPRSNCVMSSAKLESVGIRLTPIDQALEAALKDWRL